MPRNSNKKVYVMTGLQHFAKTGKKIIGVAANYKSLLKILQKPVPASPEIFLKPSTAYVTGKQKIIIPQGFSVNEEVELGVIIGRSGKNICVDEAMEFVGGYCVALDMTATCQMKKARGSGGSWTLGKGFDTSCPVSEFIPKSDIKNPDNLQLWCSVNGTQRQNGNTNDLVFSIPTLIAFISQYITLETNDLIITGSPPGMGPVQAGQVIEGGIENIICIKFHVE